MTVSNFSLWFVQNIGKMVQNIVNLTSLTDEINVSDVEDIIKKVPATVINNDYKQIFEQEENTILTVVNLKNFQ